MNPYIEFAQWLFTGIRDYWREHGTKLLGKITVAYSGVVSYLALISSSPDFDLLVTPRQFAILAIFNVVLGGATWRRGITNTANQAKP